MLIFWSVSTRNDDLLGTPRNSRLEEDFAGDQAKTTIFSVRKEKEVENKIF